MTDSFSSVQLALAGTKNSHKRRKLNDDHSIGCMGADISVDPVDL